MTVRWGFDLSMSAIRLLRREGDEWLEVQTEKIDGPDIADRLESMAKTVDPADPVAIFLPRDQILYTDVKVKDAASAGDEVRAALEGMTPYALDELFVDWVMTEPGTARVAAIALETLDEAAAFAEARGLVVAGFSALADPADFPRMPDFGEGPAMAEFADTEISEPVLEPVAPDAQVAASVDPPSQEGADGGERTVEAVFLDTEFPSEPAASDNALEHDGFLGDEENFFVADDVEDPGGEGFPNPGKGAAPEGATVPEDADDHWPNLVDADEDASHVDGDRADVADGVSLSEIGETAAPEAAGADTEEEAVTPDGDDASKPPAGTTAAETDRDHSGADVAEPTLPEERREGILVDPADEGAGEDGIPRDVELAAGDETLADGSDEETGAAPEVDDAGDAELPATEAEPEAAGMDEVAPGVASAGFVAKPVDEQPEEIAEAPPLAEESETVVDASGGDAGEGSGEAQVPADVDEDGAVRSDVEAGVAAEAGSHEDDGTARDGEIETGDETSDAEVEPEDPGADDVELAAARATVAADPVDDLTDEGAEVAGTMDADPADHADETALSDGGATDAGADDAEAAAVAALPVFRHAAIEDAADAKAAEDVPAFTSRRTSRPPDDPAEPVVKVEDSRPVVAVARKASSRWRKAAAKKARGRPRVIVEHAAAPEAAAAARSLTAEDPFPIPPPREPVRVPIWAAVLALFLTAGIGGVIWTILPQGDERPAASDTAMVVPEAAPETPPAEQAPDSAEETPVIVLETGPEVTAASPLFDTVAVELGSPSEPTAILSVSRPTLPELPAADALGPDLAASILPRGAVSPGLAATEYGLATPADPEASGALDLAALDPQEPVLGLPALPSASGFAADTPPPAGEAPAPPETDVAEAGIEPDADAELAEVDLGTVDEPGEVSAATDDERADAAASEAAELASVPEGIAPDLTDDGDPPLPEPTEFARAIPRTPPSERPGDFTEDLERARLGGFTVSELAEFRPLARPASAQVLAREARAGALSAIALSASPLPPTRPGQWDAVVAAARVVEVPDAPDTSDAVALALSEAAEASAEARATSRRVIPTEASVARQATIEDAISLSRVNLIGVFGLPTDRRALVRLSSGRYVKVKVGDRIDGGIVARITDNTLFYSKGGRTISLELPKG